MLNRLNDYSKLSFRMFFKNKLISVIVLVILLVVSVFTITVMNIFFSYIEIGEESIVEGYNKYEKKMSFYLRGEDSFTDEQMDMLSAKAKELGYDSILCSDDYVKINEEYFDVWYTNEYINDYTITSGKSLKDNCQNTDYVWLSNKLENSYAIGDKVVLDYYDDKEFEVAGFWAGEQIIINDLYLQKDDYIFFYDDMNSTKTYDEILYIYEQVTDLDFKKQMGLEPLANAADIELKYFAEFTILMGNEIEGFLNIKWFVMIGAIVIIVILLGIVGGVIKNYFNIYKEKNFNNIKMYSALGIKDKQLGYMFVMPPIVFSIAISVVAQAISALLCIFVQPVVLKFVFEWAISSYGSLYRISPAPFFINLIVIWLFVIISFVMNFKSVLSKKKAFLSEVK